MYCLALHHVRFSCIEVLGTIIHLDASASYSLKNTTNNRVVSTAESPEVSHSCQKVTDSEKGRQQHGLNKPTDHSTTIIKCWCFTLFLQCCIKSRDAPTPRSLQTEDQIRRTCISVLTKTEYLIRPLNIYFDFDFNLFDDQYSWACFFLLKILL